jgi:formylglycine-generating enzyme required for sulfatase activity
MLTIEQFARFRPLRGVHRRLPGERHPVVIVDYDEALRHCAWLTSRGPLLVRLPSEAEWENACRAGGESEYGFGDAEAGLGEHAWCAKNAVGGAGEVATRKPNRWGLFDMHGNVWEWCKDRYHPDYRNAPHDQEAWIDGIFPLRVNRGGSWTDRPSLCRSAHRDANAPSSCGETPGFHPAASSR